MKKLNNSLLIILVFTLSVFPLSILFKGDSVSKLGIQAWIYILTNRHALNASFMINSQNDGATDTTLKYWATDIGKYNYDYLVWNNGIWDAQGYPDSVYYKNMRTIADSLKRHNIKKIFFQLTTPLPPIASDRNQRVIRFNTIARTVIDSVFGTGVVRFIDEYSFIQNNRDKMIYLPDSTHYNAECYQYMAKNVLDTLEKYIQFQVVNFNVNYEFSSFGVSANNINTSDNFTSEYSSYGIVSDLLQNTTTVKKTNTRVGTRF